MSSNRPPVYIHLFHGRDSIEQDMDDWGFDGPVIGPLDYAHITYMSDIKFAASFEVMEQFFPETAKRHKEFNQQHNQPWDRYPIDHHFKFVEDCVEYDGKLYGDISIAAFPQGALDHNAGVELP